MQDAPQTKVVAVLLEYLHKEDLSITDGLGQNALTCSQSNGSLESYNLLLQKLDLHPADVYPEIELDVFGKHPLLLAGALCY